MPTIEDLNRKHDDYDAVEAGDLWAMYVGGKEFEKRYHKFLPQNPREPDQTYTSRKSHAEYRNYLGSIIKYFTDALFTSKPSAEAIDKSGEQVVELDKFWSDIKEDCTGSGTDLDAFFKDRMIEALVKSKSWTAVCQPNDGLGKANSLYEHEKRGRGNCYLKDLDYDGVYDWEIDDRGNLEWVLHHTIKRVRKGLTSKRDWIVETWTSYGNDTIDTYRIEYKENEKPSEKVDVPLVDSFEHDFGVCPVVCIALSPGDHIAATLKSSQISNFKNTSNQNWSLACTCYAQPIAKVNDKEAFTEMMMGAGHGVIIGPDEEFGWDAPPAAHFRAQESQIIASKDEIYRLGFQMGNGVENNVAAVGRTAESKIADAQSTRIALTAYGRIVKQAIERCYQLISSVRGEKYKWNIAGLDDFAGIDTSVLLAMGTQLKELGGVHSRTWNAKFEQKLAEVLMPDNDEATKAIVNQEIKEYVMTAPTEIEQQLALFEAQHAIVAKTADKGSGLVAPQNKPNAVRNKGGTKPFKGPAPKTISTAPQGSFVKAQKPFGK